MSRVPPNHPAVAATTNGTFKDIPGALTPNQGPQYTGKVLKPAQVNGTMAGYGQFAVFYASAKARKGLAPTVLKSTTKNLLYPSSTWPELLFPAGALVCGRQRGWLLLRLLGHPT